MAATQKVMEQLLDGNGEALRLSGELVLAKNKGETFAQHAADTTRHLTTAQVDTAIETALAPVQEELNQIANGGTNGGDSLKVGDILLTTNPTRDVSSFLPADGSRIRAEPYPDLGHLFGTEFIVEDAPTTIPFTVCASDDSGLGLNYHKLTCSKSQFVASLRASGYSTNITTYLMSLTGNAYTWKKKTAPEAYTDICYLNNEWLCACKSKLYRAYTADSSWSKKCDFPWTVSSSTSGYLYNLNYGDGVYFCVPTYSGKVYISTDGMKTWTPKSVYGIGDPPYSAYHKGYYMFFGVGTNTNGKMHYSTDKGETWTTVELPLPVDIIYNSMSTCELDGKFYLLGMGTVAISTDLPNWEAHPVEVTTGSTTTTYTGPVFYAEGIFIAASNSIGSAYAVSADGLKWTPATVTRPLPSGVGSKKSLSTIRATVGKGDGTIVTSCTCITTQGSTYYNSATLHSAQPTIEKKYYLTLPKVTCPGAKAYVKAL